ncbi:hypothetical protein AOC36_07175 [Erysipelothrix larvae]|uniref:Carbohydrate deacetylase n=1 Tax=Erysipelothrix larvae TaxID=1514105 RepID=A0A0X8H0G3_9FIRM|nr:carbohydrate deacetylase [Erysipelothrix larvae]AMC93771.1 hypothetical protein AOC36_07175 [Erysipelothrix larvae]
MKKVIINSDDFGYSRGINWGIMDAHTQGILTSATLMTNMPGFTHAVELAKQAPELGVGIHMVLTCGRPLLNTHKTLVDEHGNFKKQAWFKTEPFDEEEVYQEWDAQIQKAIDAGITPTHLDSHHHAHTFQNNPEIIERLGRKYNLPIRINYQASPDMRGVEHFIWDFDECGARPESEDKAYLDALLQGILDHETTEIMCHPGYLDCTIYHGSSWLENRIHILEFIIHSDFSKTLKNHPDIELVTYKEL